MSHANGSRFPKFPLLYASFARLCVRPAHSPLATPDRRCIDTFPFAAKPHCPSNSKNFGLDSTVAPIASADVKVQDTVALRSTHRAPPLVHPPLWSGPRLDQERTLPDIVSLRSPRTLLLSPLDLDVSLPIFHSFPIRFRPHHQARHLISHSPPSARSSPRLRQPFSKSSRVRTSCTTPCGLFAGSICFS